MEKKLFFSIAFVVVIQCMVYTQSSIPPSFKTYDERIILNEQYEGSLIENYCEIVSIVDITTRDFYNGLGTIEMGDLIDFGTYYPFGVQDMYSFGCLSVDESNSLQGMPSKSFTVQALLTKNKSGKISYELVFSRQKALHKDAKKILKQLCKSLKGYDFIKNYPGGNQEEISLLVSLPMYKYVSMYFVRKRNKAQEKEIKKWLERKKKPKKRKFT